MILMSPMLFGIFYDLDINPPLTSLYREKIVYFIIQLLILSSQTSLLYI